MTDRAVAGTGTWARAPRNGGGAMIVVDRDGRISVFSRAAQDLLGHDASAMIGRSVDPLVEGGWPAVRAVAESGGAQAAGMIAVDGDRMPVALSVERLRDGYVLFFVDTLERQAADLRRSLFESAARDVALAEFAAHMMHELNQPLAAASNFLAVAQELISRLPAGGDVGAIVDMALDQIRRLGETIRDTGRKAAGTDLDPRPIAVGDAIADAVALIQGAGTAIPIVVDVRPGTMTMVVDPIGIQQVLTNLLRNAVAAFGPTPPQGARIDVTARWIDRRVTVSIADNGPGIPPAMMPGLFNTIGPRDGNGGIALGLSICRTIVERHEGILSAQNLAGGGACFTITLPQRQRTHPA